jgi:hypothetical protein
MPNPNSKGTSELKSKPGEETITKASFDSAQDRRKLEGTKKSQRSFSFVFSPFRAFVIGCSFGLPFPTLGALFQ